MKKLLAGMILVLVMAFGLGINSANATFWTPTESGAIDTNYFGSSSSFAIFDDSDTNLTGAHLVLDTNMDVVKFTQNGSDWDLLLNDVATGFTLTGSNTFQIGWLDPVDGLWKIDTGYTSNGSNSVIEWDYGDSSVTLSQGDAGPSSVPIPAAVWLLGSGLFGMVAIRRRSKKEGIGMSSRV